VTLLWLTAPLFRLAVETELPGFAGLRALLTGGDVVSAEHARRFLEALPSCALINGYGPTENTTFSCCYRVPSAESIRAALPIVGPIANSSAYVLDRNLRAVKPGASGELCVGGDGLARGYLNLPELSAERFVRDPFAADPEARLYRTGDLARVRPDGLLDFLGRLDHQVKIRGFRIELEEIEAVLRGDPSVADAAVCVVDRDGDKALYAVVVAAREGIDEQHVRRLLAAKLPAHAVPASVAFAPGLPRHPSGKLDRRALAERAAAAPPRSGNAGTVRRPL
jgi:acyl-CoA synthetase (AMP-forming)/AMP-acid ligase II